MLARVLLLRIERWLEAEGVFDVAEFGDVVLATELDRAARGHQGHRLVLRRWESPRRFCLSQGADVIWA